MKRITLIILLLIIFFWPCSAWATFTYTQDFESEALDQRYPADETGCSDDIYWSNNNPKVNCDNIIRDDITARFGTKYSDTFCDWVDGTDTEVARSQRAQTTFGRASGWSECNEMEYNDGTEYWFGWSVYIMPDYYEEYYPHMIFEFTTTGSYIPLALYFGGGETQDSTPNHSWRWCAYYDGGLHCNDFSNDNDWRDEKGQWADIVIQARFYTTDDANATIKVWKNGVIQYSRSGGDNVDGGGAIFSMPLLYNIYNSDSYLPHTLWIRAADDSLGATSKWRETPVDELRITEQTEGSGTYNYCSVTPPIWPVTPVIQYPTADADGINTTVTVTYSGYSDHRSDSQSCFAYTTTWVEVDEDGGDWGTLVYDSGWVDSETSNEVSGLAYNTKYQMRVTHRSLRSGTADTYDSTTSGIIDFTTKSGESSDPMSVSNINSGGLAVSNINSGGISVTPK